MTNPQRHEDIFSSIIQCYNNLTKSETKVADFVLHNRHRIHALSISELAAACDVSEATVSRFCHTVGSSSFNEFKLAAVHFSSSMDSLGLDMDLYSTLQPGDTVAQKCRKLCSVSMEALQQTLHELDEDAISNAVDIFSKAKSVYCFGQGNSGIVAEDAWGRFSTVSTKFHYISNANLQATTAHLLGEGDVVLYFSFSSSVRELTEVGQMLAGTKAKLVLVTRFPNAPGTQFADLLLICGANEAPQQQGSIAAKIGQLFIVDVLFHEFCARNQITSVFSSPDMY
jgi:DNA-binding MurR/RpiR family transcriptional regulator